jgi:type IV fimbrial biogenesis protein FimT
MKHARGFNLIELMVAIGLLGILLGWGVPAFRDLSRNNSVTVANNDLITSFNLARSEALRRNRPVTVCASGDGAACNEDTDWARGWIAFTDRGNPGEVDGDDQVLQVWQPANNLVLFNADAEFVQFLPTGMTGSSTTIEISWDGCHGQHSRRVGVIATGAITSGALDCPS